MEQKQQFPTEQVTLPTKGLLYPEGSPLKSGVVRMKYMTAREEDILTNQNYIKNGTVIDKLLESLIVTPIDYNTLLSGDKDAILIAARVLGYGNEYTFDYNGEKVTVDLNDVKDIYLDESLITDGKNAFSFTLPTSKALLTFKLLTQEDEKKIEQEIKGLKKINKNADPQLTTRLKHTILSVNGDRTTKTVRDFIDKQFLARDSRAFRNYVDNITPDIDLTFDITFSDGAVIEDLQVPIGVGFFWPDASV